MSPENHLAPMALLSCLLPVSGQCLANPNPEPATPEAPIQTIVITADPFSRSAHDVVNPTDILTGKELERSLGANLGETLSSTLGVNSADFGRGTGRPVIRGQGGPRVQTLVNGLATMDAASVSSDHDVSVDPAHAEQVEILKGPATLLFGSGAAAGVVNLVDGRLPRSLTPGLRANLGMHYGSNGEQNHVAGQLRYGGKAWQAGIDGSWTDADNYESGDGREIENSVTEKKSGAISLARFSERVSIAASVSGYETEYGLPIEEQAFIDLEQDRADFEARLIQPLDGLKSIRFRFSRGDYQHQEFEEPGELGTTFTNDESDGRIEFVHQAIAGLDGVFGVHHRWRDFTVEGEEAFLPSTRTRGFGAFLVEQRPTDFGSFEFGLRLDNEERDPRSSSQATRSFDLLSWSAGVLVELGDLHHLKVLGNRSERAPSLEELYSFGEHLASGTVDIGDPELNIERTRSLELSLSRYDDPWIWQINLFVQDSNDYIYQAAARQDFPEFDSDLPILVYQADDVRFWGAEAETAFQWDQAAATWELRLFGDWVRGRVQGGSDLPRISPARLGASLDLQYESWSGLIQATHNFRQDRVAPGETPTDGFTLLEAHLEYLLTPGEPYWRLFLRGQNLLDEQARRHTSFIKDVAPLSGISATIGIEYRFE